jgi:hypothetical protein
LIFMTLTIIPENVHVKNKKESINNILILKKTIKL